MIEMIIECFYENAGEAEHKTYENDRFCALHCGDLDLNGCASCEGCWHLGGA